MLVERPQNSAGTALSVLASSELAAANGFKNLTAPRSTITQAEKVAIFFKSSVPEGCDKTEREYGAFLRRNQTSIINKTEALMQNQTRSLKDCLCKDYLSEKQVSHRVSQALGMSILNQLYNLCSERRCSQKRIYLPVHRLPMKHGSVCSKLTLPGKLLQTTR